MYEVVELRLTKTLLEHISSHIKHRHSYCTPQRKNGTILADRHLSSTTVNIADLMEHIAKQEDHNQLETNGGEGGRPW